ncbi:hypothetical protein HAHE_09160 [Haloferula helveola]|uniref:DUF2066 domain-containing protein n=1 Tax=Haloferula helveola TaxID=490095 RepID=A0ABN6H1V1_9BACT|nr:hypothetical protein HAHE_09160 [Haloferula helveola]
MKHLLLSLSLVAGLHAAEFDPARVSPDAKWWLHADLEAARATELGKRVVAEVDEKKGDQLRALKRMFSVNPMTDLKGITLYGDGQKDHAVALIEGNFDRAHLEDIAKAADKHESEEREGLVIHSWTDKGKRQHAVFVRDDLLVFSHFEDLLDSAITTLKSGNGLTADPFVGAGAAAPFLVGYANLQEVEMGKDESKLLGHAETLRIAMTEAAGRMEGRMQLEVVDKADGDRFRMVMDGMVALGELGNPDLRAADISFDSRSEEGGKTVRCTLSFPTSDLISLMEKAKAFDKIGK